MGNHIILAYINRIKSNIRLLGKCEKEDNLLIIADTDASQQFVVQKFDVCMYV